MDITIIVFNNQIYGMTGGQYSPTTPEDMYASTAPYGNVENDFDVVKLAVNSGATYVARSTVYHYAQMVTYIRKAVRHKGCSVVEILTNCHTYFGRYNGVPEPTSMLEYFKKNAIPLTKAAKMPKEELAGKIITGEFINVEMETYNDRYEKLKEKLLEENEE